MEICLSAFPLVISASETVFQILLIEKHAKISPTLHSVFKKVHEIFM